MDSFNTWLDALREPTSKWSPSEVVFAISANFIHKTTWPSLLLNSLTANELNNSIMEFPMFCPFLFKWIPKSEGCTRGWRSQNWAAAEANPVESLKKEAVKVKKSKVSEFTTKKRRWWYLLLLGWFWCALNKFEVSSLWTILQRRLCPA